MSKMLIKKSLVLFFLSSMFPLFSGELQVNLDYEINLEAIKFEANDPKQYINVYFEILLCPKDMVLDGDTTDVRREKIQKECVQYKKSTQDRNFYRIAKYFRGDGTAESFVSPRARNEGTRPVISKIRLVDLYKARAQKNIALDNLSIYIMANLQTLSLDADITKVVPPCLELEQSTVKSIGGGDYYPIYEGDDYKTSNGEAGAHFEKRNTEHDFKLSHNILEKRYINHQYIFYWNPLEVGLDPQGDYSTVQFNKEKVEADISGPLKHFVVKQTLKQVRPDEVAQKYLQPIELFSPLVASAILQKKVSQLTLLYLLILQNLSLNPHYNSLEVFKAVENKRYRFNKAEIDAFQNATASYASNSAQHTFLEDYAESYRSLALSIHLEAEALSSELSAVTKVKEDDYRKPEKISIRGQEVDYVQALNRYQLYKMQSADAAAAFDSIGAAFMDGVNKMLR